MKQKDYQKSIDTDVTAKEAFHRIADVRRWWTNTFKGKAVNVNDKFEVTFGKTNVKFEVTEAIPFSKLVWQVTDCYLDWINDKTEWKGTEIIWEVSEGRKGTKITMTHHGLVPGLECYNDCEAGWNQYVGESIPKLISTGMGILFDGR